MNDGPEALNLVPLVPQLFLQTTTLLHVVWKGLGSWDGSLPVVSPASCSCLTEAVLVRRIAVAGLVRAASPPPVASSGLNLRLFGYDWQAAGVDWVLVLNWF